MAPKTEGTVSLTADERQVIVGPITTAIGTECTTNVELAERFGTTPDVLLRKTGIESRPRAAAEISPRDLAMQAAESLISNPGFDPGALSMVIVSSSTIGQACPSVACDILGMIQTRFPQQQDIMAFDIMATCAGWLYGLKLACDHMQNEPFRRGSALIVTTEVLSKVMAPDDFGTWVSFGDAATATLALGPDAVLPGGDGRRGFLGMKRPLAYSHGDVEMTLSGPPLGTGGYMQMNGGAVRQQSLPAMVKALHAALKVAGLKPEDLDAILAHQSNQRILADIGSAMGVAPELMVSNLRTTGNTSSSALPLLLNDLRNDGRLNSGARLAFTAFGGGYTYAATTATVL